MKDVSENQINANRENAKKGGVKTREGKEVSKKNAIKHGVLSLMKTQYEEIRFEKLYDELASEYKVETIGQRMLLEQLVSCYIKLARCAKFETKITLKRIEDPWDFTDPFDSKEKEKENDPSIERKFIFDKKAFEVLEPVLLRYEPMLVKRMLSLMKELRELRGK